MPTTFPCHVVFFMLNSNTNCNCLAQPFVWDGKIFCYKFANMLFFNVIRYHLWPSLFVDYFAAKTKICAIFLKFKLNTQVLFEPTALFIHVIEKKIEKGSLIGNFNIFYDAPRIHPADSDKYVTVFTWSKSASCTILVIISRIFPMTTGVVTCVPQILFRAIDFIKPRVSKTVESIRHKSQFCVKFSNHFQYSYPACFIIQCLHNFDRLLIIMVYLEFLWHHFGVVDVMLWVGIKQFSCLTAKWAEQNKVSQLEHRYKFGFDQACFAFEKIRKLVCFWYHL